MNSNSYDAYRMRIHRSENETALQRYRRLKYQRDYARKKLESETDEQREIRLAKTREYNRKYRHEKTRAQRVTVRES